MKEKEAEKRAIEKLIFDHKLQEVEIKLAQLRTDKRQMLSKRNQFINLISEAEKQEDDHQFQIQAFESEINQIQRSIDHLKDMRNGICNSIQASKMQEHNNADHKLIQSLGNEDDLEKLQIIKARKEALMAENSDLKEKKEQAEKQYVEHKKKVS